MNINFCFHSNISPEDKEKAEEYVAKKMSPWDKLFSKDDFPPKITFEFQFLIRKKHFRVEFQLETGLGKFIAVSIKKNILEGIDETLDDIKNQLKKQKDKLLTFRKRGGVSIKKKFSIHRSARFRKKK